MNDEDIDELKELSEQDGIEYTDFEHYYHIKDMEYLDNGGYMFNFIHLDY